MTLTPSTFPTIANRKWIAIAAMSQNRVIGKNNDLPWKSKEDMAFFKRTTTGHTVLMGRNTWESMGSKPLPNRRNIILSSTLGIVEGASVIRSVNDYITDVTEPVFIIGGAKVYKDLIPTCDEVYLTVFKFEVEGDTFMPPIEENLWEHKDVIYEDDQCTRLHFH